MDHVDWSTVFSSIAALSALVTVVIAWLGTRYAAESWRAQTEPKVIVYVKHDKDRPSLLLLVIENIGRDVAHHVKFRPSRSLPFGAWGMAGDTINPAPPMDRGPIITGIPALGPGDSRIINWGQFEGLRQAIGDEAIVVDYSYNARNRTIHERTYLEVESFGPTDASESPAATSAKQLEKIAGSTKDIAGSVRSIHEYLRDSSPTA